MSVLMHGCDWFAWTPRGTKQVAELRRHAVAGLTSLIQQERGEFAEAFVNDRSNVGHGHSSKGETL